MASEAIEGCLNVAKEAGPTSHDVVALVRRAAGARKVGHAGTLDPAASGVLPVLVGRVTRLARFFGAYRKRYRAVIKLGAETDTGDAVGEVISEHGVSQADYDRLPDIVGRFIGDIVQEVPAYAAVKQAGEPLYAKARRGEVVKPPARVVSIYQFEILDVEPPFVSVLLECGGGTYVRALARDIGRTLGVGAHLTELERLAVGPFVITDALPQARIRAGEDLGVAPHFTAAAGLLPEIPAETLSPKAAADFAHGREFPVAAWLRPAAPVRAFTADGVFLGIGFTTGAGSARPDTVLVTAEEL